MTYALIQDGAVAAYPYTIAQFQAANPNVSLPATPTEEQLNEQGIYTVYPSPKPEYNPITQNCTEGTPEEKWAQWYQNWVVTSATPQEIHDRQNAAMETNKQQASQLLTATDWTTIPDVGNPAVSNPYLVNVQDFVNYRNQVRAIAVNPPITVDVWPTLPQEVWGPIPEVEPTTQQ